MADNKDRGPRCELGNQSKNVESSKSILINEGIIIENDIKSVDFVAEKNVEHISTLQSSSNFKGDFLSDSSKNDNLAENHLSQKLKNIEEYESKASSLETDKSSNKLSKLDALPTIEILEEQPPTLDVLNTELSGEIQNSNAIQDPLKDFLPPSE